jgi:hypothetical protein
MPAMDERERASSMSGPIRETPCIPDVASIPEATSQVPSHEGTHKGVSAQETAVNPNYWVEAVE